MLLGICRLYIYLNSITTDRIIIFNIYTFKNINLTNNNTTN